MSSEPVAWLEWISAELGAGNLLVSAKLPPAEQDQIFAMLAKLVTDVLPAARGRPLGAHSRGVH
jgi:hypothetical protein